MLRPVLPIVHDREVSVKPKNKKLMPAPFVIPEAIGNLFNRHLLLKQEMI